MPTDATSPPPAPDVALRLPADDPEIFELDLRGLRRRWAARAALPAISAETMTGADLKAQALGYPAGAVDGARGDGRRRGRPRARRGPRSDGGPARS